MRKSMTQKGRTILKKNYSRILPMKDNIMDLYVSGYCITAPILVGHKFYEVYNNNRYTVKMTSDRVTISIIAGLISGLFQGIVWPITVPCTIYDIYNDVHKEKT